MELTFKLIVILCCTYFTYPESLIVGKLVALLIYCKISTALGTTGAVMTGTLNMIILYAGRKRCHNIYPSHYWSVGHIYLMTLANPKICGCNGI